jgi:sterol desaturase/sphingolipid hydroxylase (fatty acid hydroxylase superfamily)
MSTSKKKPASTDFSINWFSTSIFVVVCVGLVAFYGITSNLSASVKELLTVMWAMQSGIWDSLTSNGIPSGFVVSLVIIVIILLIEHIRPWRKLQKRFRKEFWLDVIYNVLSFGFYNLLGLGLAYALIVGPFNYFLLSVFNLEYPLVYLIDQVPMWLRIVLAVICAEYVSYWAHRLQHNVDFLWHIHKIHHSSQELDVMNAQRLHWLELLWLNLSSYTVLGVIGFNAVEIMAVNFFTYFLCYFTHANVFCSNRQAEIHHQ